LYDLAFVEHGPLPPHERSWRHPSELGPTRADVEVADSTGRTPMMALAGGTLAVMAVAVMVVAMTPRTSQGPIALSATTTPIITIATARVEALDQPALPARAQSLQLRTTDTLLASFSAFPHSVTRIPQLDLDGTAVAEELPLADDVVLVRTDAVTYEMRWTHAQSMAAPDGSVVFDLDGELVAHVAAGELVSLVDD
jgi:hypothetical protein